MSAKRTRNEGLRDRLARSREIHISVTGRKSGRTISVPVWFASDDEKLYLLPARGSDTQWYKNVLKKPAIRIGAGGNETELKVILATDAKRVSAVIEKFRGKYGDSGLKLYAKLDAAVLADLP